MADKNYGYEALTVMPPHMRPWGNRLDLPLMPSKFGEYVLVDAQPASVEQHHQVMVLDENGRPLAGVWVIFAWTTGPPINFNLTENLWRGAPQVLRGNPQRTNGYGYVQHTTGEGGESIFVYDIDTEGRLLLPSPIVHDNHWINTSVPGVLYEHNGVLLTFQRRLSDVVPEGDRWADFEARLSRLEDFTGINE